MEDLVSVIITTYGRSDKYLEQAINSVMAQTYKNIEIVLVDDNGVDPSCHQYCKNRYSNEKSLIYIKNPRNMGAQYSRNIGILFSKGDFIAFLDDDDFWLPEKLEKQMKCFTDDSIGMSFCGGFEFSGDNTEKRKKYHEDRSFVETLNYEKMLFEDLVGTTTQVVIRRECFAKCGLFDCSMPARQDYEMWIRISEHYRIVGINEPLFYHRVHDGEQISKSFSKAFSGHKRILEKYSEDYRRFPKAKAKRLLKLCYFSFHLHNYLLAAVYLGRAFANSPSVTINTLKSGDSLHSQSIPKTT